MANQVDLKSLLKGIPVSKWSGKKENVFISGITQNSKAVQNDFVFFAIQGSSENGSNFIEEAISRGATVIISEASKSNFGQITHIQVDDVRKTMALLAKKFYNNPDENLNLVGITGTSGKTTTAFLLQHIYKYGFEEKTGLLGTLKYDLGKRSLVANRTTPDAISIASYLSEMDQEHCKNAVIEVSSHGMDQKRVSELNFNTAVFTNLSEEHLDYHNSMQNYFNAKKALFEKNIQSAVINADDEYGQKLINTCNCNIISYAINSEATLKANNIVFKNSGTSFDLLCNGNTFKVKTKLLGEFNVYNTLAALAACFAQKYDLNSAIKAMRSFDGISGRMESVTAKNGAKVFVDYAHKPKALESALKTAKTITNGRVYVVFGCGGNRDRLKRPIMMQIANNLADKCFVTVDNPRNEAQDQIFDDMKKGLTNPSATEFFYDRKQAISAAISSCSPNDCILIAGKGHEKYQEILGQFIPFDDISIATM